MDLEKSWRLALMFDAPGNDLTALSGALARSGRSIREAALGHAVRMGVADRHPDLGAWALRDPAKGWADVDGAVEVTLPEPRIAETDEICRALRGIMADFCAPGSVEVMAGPVFSMVPVRQGTTFLSLAFRRDPVLTSAEFRDWWFNHHSGVAIPVLGSDLLAYDQVHVEEQASRAAAAAFGAEFAAYDAYDNLTWANRTGYLHSISDDEAMAPVYADEVGKIDPSSRRSAIMIEIR